MSISGELKQFHKTTLTFEGPTLSEEAATFTDYRLDVTFTHESGETLTIPGYFAADGDAANSGATSGNLWNVHFTAPLTGAWTYEVSFVSGTNVAALRSEPGTPLAFDGETGSFDIAASDKTGDDARANGILSDANGDGYLETSGNGEVWFKTGVDSPENFFGYEEFDGTSYTRNGNQIRYNEHRSDFDAAVDPTWNDGDGDEIIGAVNYLAEQGVNSIYIITMNANGDGKDTWPWVNPDFAQLGSSDNNRTMTEAVNAVDGLEFEDFVTFDVSKLDQWQIVADHMTSKGVGFHLLTQETENDQLLDDTGLGTVPGTPEMSIERAIYLREMMARFGYSPYLQWNLGEENTGSDAQRAALFAEIDALDPYNHHVAIHSFPNQQNDVYEDLLGNPDVTGASLQSNAWSKTHADVSRWVEESENAGQRWVVMADETTDAGRGTVPDTVSPGKNEERSEGLWGTIMAGGGGIEWYMGGNDQNLSDFATRAEAYRQATIARELIEDFVPIEEMAGADDLLVSSGQVTEVRVNGTTTGSYEGHVLAKPGEVYLVYTEDGAEDLILDLTGASGTFAAYWWDPYEGGLFELGSVEAASGGQIVNFGPAPEGVRDNRVTDNTTQGNRELIVNDAVLLVKNVDLDLGLTADDVLQGRLVAGDFGSNPDNLPPDVSPQTLTVEEDAGMFAGTLAATDFGSDPDGPNGGLIYFFEEPPSSLGEFQLAGEGSILFFTPDDDANGTETVQVSFWDQVDASVLGTTTLTINVTPINDAPTASDGDLNVSATGSVSLDPVDAGLADDIDGDDLIVTISADPDEGTASAANGVVTYTPNAAAAGTTQSFDYTVTDPSGAFATATITVDVGDAAPPSDLELVVAYNIGSNSAYTAQDGTVFEADTVSDARQFSSNGEIENTEDDTLYQTEAWKPADLTFAFDVENGHYLVRTHFAEIWTGAYAPGVRVFDVVVEDILVEDDLDLAAQFGPRTAYISEATVTVSDGELNILLDQIKQNPKLSALEIYRVTDDTPDPVPPVGEAFLVDAGSDVLLAPLGGTTVIDADAVAGLQLSVGAFDDGSAESAVLTLFDGVGDDKSQTNVQTENFVPYALFGDNNGNYKTKNLVLEEGDARSVEVEYFSEDAAAGEALGSLGLDLLVQDDGLSGGDASAVLFLLDETTMGTESIEDFDADDTLAFIGGADEAEVLASASVVDGDTVIDFGGGNELTLVSFVGLGADDLTFA
ncbi:MAG: malectin domain-containing carbohydrate-binding protein [Pseudomonadota bacterium]